MSPGSHSETSPDPVAPEGGSRFVFPELDIRGPVEALEATAERKLRTFRNLGEDENAQRLERAVEIARTRLRAVLSSPKTIAGS